jgi:hypothetical protein
MQLIDRLPGIGKTTRRSSRRYQELMTCFLMVIRRSNMIKFVRECRNKEASTLNTVGTMKRIQIEGFGRERVRKKDKRKTSGIMAHSIKTQISKGNSLVIKILQRLGMKALSHSGVIARNSISLTKIKKSNRERTIASIDNIRRI